MRRYLAVRPPAGRTGTRLLCFHHAGAGAMSFAGWQHRMRQDLRVLPVRLPGRETRLRERRITEGAELVGELDSELGPLLDEQPYVFYGHSLGALVAYRLALRRVQRGGRGPSALLVGACTAPHRSTAFLDRIEPGELTDSQLLRVTVEAVGRPEALQHRPSGLAILLATLRADLLLARSLRADPVTPLPCPIEAFAGRQDHMVTARDMAAWRDCTSARFRLRTLAGAHFFVRDAELPHVVEGVLKDESLLPANG